MTCVLINRQLTTVIELDSRVDLPRYCSLKKPGEDFLLNNEFSLGIVILPVAKVCLLPRGGVN